MAIVFDFVCSYGTKLLWFVLLLQTVSPESSSVTSRYSTVQQDYELCRKGEILQNYALRGGRNAGAYYRIGNATNVDECVHLCCSNDDCHLAILVKSSCFSVECRSAELCKPIKVHGKSTIRPWIFRRYRAAVDHDRDSSFQLPDLSGSNVTLKRDKRFGSCQHYTGQTCDKYLDEGRLIYYEEIPNVVEHRLSGPFTVIQGHFSPQCKKYALPALCLTSFPYCESKLHPRPIRLCKEDCEKLYQGICNHDFNLAQRVAKKYPLLLKIMPDCSNLTAQTKEDDNCVKLGLSEGDHGVSTTATSLKKLELRVDGTMPAEYSTAHTSHQHQNELAGTEAKTDNPTTQPLNEIPLHSPTSTDGSDSDHNDTIPYFSDLKPTKTFTEAVEMHLSAEKESGEWVNHSNSNNHEPRSEMRGKIDASNALDNKSHETHSQKVDTEYSTPTLAVVSPAKADTKSVKLLSSVSTEPNQTVASLDHSRPSQLSTTASPSTESTVPTILNINGSKDGLDLQAVNKIKKKGRPSTVRHQKVPTKASVINLQVSTVGDKEITLPKDTASLYASAWPKESPTHPYSYQWLQIASPEDSHGYMEGKSAQRVVLTQLKKPGIYQFEVIVRGPHHAFGKAFVNVTVKEPQRVNKPPRADISPKEQSITLPTNEVVLDGSKSSDDDKIVEYKWQELKGPLTEKNKMVKTGVDSPVLQLKSLFPGVYTYKLTVTDSDGETDSTTATVTVNAEKDYPPVARAGNDVVITLPVNVVTLYGNGSSDDHGIKSYEWSKSPLSPACDLQGTTGPILHVSNMVEGDYIFALKVTDTGGQNSVSKVTVVVRPEKNSPPVAKAGDDKDLVYPDDSTILNAKESHDDQGIYKYKWEKISGPSSVEMSGVDDMVLSLSHLTEGHYVFKLTVYDSKGLTGTDTVSVNVKRDGNKPPRAEAGPDVIVKLPNRAAALDGSKSSDDYGITEYCWTRGLKSPAAGDVINGSNHQPILRLSNLVKGVYKFRLTVKDAKKVESSDEAQIIVKEDENSPNLVELYLDVDVTSFTEENKRQLVRKLAVSLNVMDSDIVIEHIQPSGRGNSLVVLFYVRDGIAKLIRNGKDIADLLKQKLSDNFFEFRMQEVEPYVCRNNCSGHGYCDQHTKQCICESFWMQDPFKARFGVRESNCDWSILYVTVVTFGVIVALVGITWGVCFCLERTKTRRRKNQYSIVGDEDSDDARNATMELFPRGKFLNSSIMSETDMDSDEETLFENQKPYKGGRQTQLNGLINGNKKKSHHT